MARKSKSKSTAVGTTYQLTYGTAEIVGFEGGWRIEIYRPTNAPAREPWNHAVRERVMVASSSDSSPRHDKLGAGYDSRCSCCYLNITHSRDKHAAAIPPAAAA